MPRARTTALLRGTRRRRRGGFALVRMSGNARNWLLIKTKDEFADARRRPVVTLATSVLTGRTVKGLAAEPESHACHR